jgi:HEAT repeat protein
VLDAIDRFVDQKTEPAVRMTALMGLARIGTPAAVERLEGIATRFSVSNIMLRNLLDVLAEMPDARPDLAARLLDDRTERVRARAAGVLAHSRSGAADGLLAASGAVEARFALMARQSAPEGTMQDLEAHVRSLETPLAKARLLDVLREVGGEANVPLVCILVADPDAGVSTNASHTLGRIASAAGAPCLVEAARSENETIRLTALKNLQLVPAVDQLADLEKIVRKARAAGDETTAALGIAAIGRAGGPEAESFLEGMIGARETRIRIASAVALFALGNDEAGTVAEEVFEQTEGPWGINDHVEWGLLAQRIDGRTLPLVERAVEEGNPSLREKVLGALMDARSPDAVFLLEHVQLERWGDTTLEYRHPGSGKVYGFTSAVLGEMGRRGDGAGRRDLLGRLLDSQDAFMRALGLRFLLPSDGEWAASRASGALGSETDPWLRLEAVRALAVLAAGGSGTTGGGA